MLQLIRVKTGIATNSIFMFNGKEICKAIEIGWNNNRIQQSAIPNGVYELKPFSGARFQNVFEICNVPNRTGILIHAANNALSELKGCIAPVTEWGISLGTGTESRKAFNKLEEIIKKNKINTITINSNIFVLPNDTI
jgi:hypothetical protein